MNSVEFTIHQSRSFTFEMSTTVEPRAFHFHAFLLKGLGHAEGFEKPLSGQTTSDSIQGSQSTTAAG